MACVREVSELMLPLWEEVLWPFLDVWEIVCVYAQPPSSELFLLFLEKEPMVLREMSRLGPSIRPHGELLLLLMQKKPTFVPDSDVFNSNIGDGPRVEGRK